MKISCVFLLSAFLTTEVFGLSLRNKRQAENNNNGLEDRYGWMLPSWYPTRVPPQWNTRIPDRRFPGQSPIFGQYPDQGFYPDSNLYPGTGLYPDRRPVPGQFPNVYPNPGQFPDIYPDPGQPTRPYPGQGPFPGQEPFPGQGPLPGQGSRPGQRPLPGQGPLPGQRPFPDQGLQMTTQNPINGTTTTTPAGTDLIFNDCISNCPVTSEYNPVCGTNNVTYPNPGRLYCAQACGTNVNLLRSSPCPSTTAAS